MLEIKLTVDIPGLPEALVKLAKAIAPTETCAPESPAHTGEPAETSAAKTAADSAPAAEQTSGAQAPATSAEVTATAAPSPAEATAQKPAAPAAAGPKYSRDQIARAGAELLDAGKMDQLIALLTKFGVQAVTQLQAEQYTDFAAELRALGAKI